jgi:tyrocidine synthetase-3
LNENSNNLEIVNKPSDLAYIIYTSGSIGQSKGVMIEHKNVVQLLFNDKLPFDFKETDIWTMFHSYNFDFSVWEMYGALLYGGELIIVPKIVAQNTKEFLKLIKDTKVTVLNQVPSAFYNLVEEEMKYWDNELRIRFIIFGGESLKPTKLKDWTNRYKHTKLINMYGITETTVHVTFKEITKKDVDINLNNIGRPLPTMTTYIMDKNSRLLPIGITGELCVGGHGVGRGYLNNPELTKEKFIENPYKPGERIYKSGDLARWLPDGNIEYLGRMDHQVKVRGFRIELGEIENKLLKDERIKEAVVLTREDQDGNKDLVAYIVTTDELDISAIKAQLSSMLPDYMIPSFFVKVESIPLTSNGKVDRKKLLSIENTEHIHKEHELPGNNIENKLVEIWKDILDVKEVGVKDNFFKLGGHSLKAATLISRIHKEFSVDMPLRAVFTNGNIKSIAEYIMDAESIMYSSIEKASEREYYPSSSAQKRLFILNKLEGDNVTYNMPIAMLAEGKLDKGRFERAFKTLIQRHESLRTSFELVDQEPIQRIVKGIEFNIDYIKLQKESVESKISDFIRPFDLGKAPLLRVGLIELEEDRNIILIDMHHIISDGESISIFLNELVNLYEGTLVPELKIQYKDFSEWQNRLLKTERVKEQEKYWLDKFAEEIPVLNMPLDYQRPPVQSFRGDRVSFGIDKKLSEGLHLIASETGSTLYMVLLAGFNILLSKYSGQEDIVIGTPIAGRSHSDLGNVIGMFVNMLAMRNYPRGDKTFKEFLSEVKENALEAYENQDYQFEELVHKLEAKRDLGRNPLFDNMFVMQDNTLKEVYINGLRISPFNINYNISKYDISLYALESTNCLDLIIEYNVNLFRRDTIIRFFNHFVNVLNQITWDTDKKISNIDLLSQTEKNQILFDFNNTEKEYNRTQTINELFVENVKKIPNSIAVSYDGKDLTYRELNQKASQLAAILTKKGIRAGSIVALMVERSLEMMIGIMGILKAGGAYLPISPSSPFERVQYMINDSEVKILLVTDDYHVLSNLECEILNLKDSELYSGNDYSLLNPCMSRDLVYILYTSGSTGNPKGVLIEHYSLVNRLQWMKEFLEIKENDILLQKTPYTFDVSAFELFLWALSGIKLCFMRPDEEKDPVEIVNIIEKEKISIIHFVPSMLSTFLNYVEISKSADKLDSLRFVCASGEVLTLPIVNRFYNILGKYGIKLINLYGPTETTIEVSYYICLKETELQSIPIGKPIYNTQLYICDKNNNLQPIGIPGELFISGHGVGRGYLNNPELTKEKFIENPYKPGERIYKSGDLARWLPDGNIEYLGRMDHQVKVRGFRIELGEIENKLLKDERIKEAVVLTREDQDGNKDLVAYIVTTDELDISAIKAQLSSMLPDYMIPSFFVKVESIPLTSNGKVDRKKLLSIENTEHIHKEHELPGNNIENKLVEIWKDILDVKEVGVKDNFFKLGGHSLKAATLISRIHKEFSVDMPLRAVFTNGNIKSIAEYIMDAESIMYSSIEKASEREYYPSSSAQKRLFILNKLEGDNVTYNMPIAMLAEGKLDKGRFERAFKTLIQRHESLRTSFELVDQEPIQRIVKGIEFNIDYIKLQKESVESKISDFIRPFDLGKAPLLRVGLIELEEDRNIILIDMHHIISDGESISIFLNELVNLYEGTLVPELKIQYKDFSEWQNRLLKTERVKEQEKYWLDKFAEEIPVLNMPLDYQRPPVQSFRGDRVSFGIDKKLSEGLHLIASETGSTLYMVLLAGFNILLSKYSGQEDIVIGTPIAGRSHSDLGNVIGMFVNMLAMRNYPRGDKTFKEFLSEVKENALEAYENQDYQFEELVHKLEAKRDLGRNPLFSVCMNMVNINDTLFATADFSIRPYPFSFDKAKFDMTLYIDQNENGLSGVLEYKTSLFDKKSILILIKHYTEILGYIINDINILLDDIGLSNHLIKSNKKYNNQDDFNF